MSRYQIRRSGRARRLRITVRPAGVEVVAPLGMRDAEIAAFVAGNQRWIETKLEAIRRRLAAHAGSSRLVDGARIPFRGGWQRLQVVQSDRARPLVRHDGDIRVELPGRLPAALQESEVERVLTGWLRREARARGEGVDRPLRAAPRPRAARPRDQGAPHALGQLHGERRGQPQLAPDPGAAGRARLRGRARALPSAPPPPPAAVLAPGRRAPAGLRAAAALAAGERPSSDPEAGNGRRSLRRRRGARHG